MSSVDKHLKTLIKYLRSLAETCKDPVVIEHTLKQVKNIEKINKDIKKTISNKESYGEASKVMGALFTDSNEGN